MKSISILGSCVSRNLFNYKELSDKYNVAFYAFQTNTWNMFEEGLDVDDSIINAIQIENFLRRMFDLDVNKKIISELKRVHSDYLVIDLFTTGCNCLKLTKGKKTVFINNNAIVDIYRYLKNHTQHNIVAEMVSFTDIDDKFVLKGLEQLAQFIKQNYSLEKVCIIVPQYATKYLDAENRLKEFAGQDLDTIINRRKVVTKYSDFLYELLPGCKKLIPQSISEYCVYLSYDKMGINPGPVHFPKYDERKIAQQLASVLEDENCVVDELKLVKEEYDALNNCQYKTINILRKIQDSVITSLNHYVTRFIDLNRHIVVVSVKHEASTKLHKFYEKNKIELNMKIAKAQSYIGIVDKSSNFKYEEASDSSLVYTYNKNGKILHVKSAGAYCGNVSSIMIDGKEYSQNRRGLNFTVLDNTTFEVLQSFYCDTYDDDYVMISLMPVN